MKSIGTGRTTVLRAIRASAVGVIAMIACVPALAELVLNSKTYIGSDCSGVFGTGFENCKVNNDPDGSPIIIKFTGQFSVSQINSAFPSIDGTEWSFTGGGTSGTWTYNPDADDPGVRYWVVKAGSQFVLNWFTDGIAGTYENAVLVPTGQAINWATGVQQGVSHFSFYDTAPVPEPSTWAMLLAGLGMLGLMARRRAKQS